jgi:hypothetical protein
VEPDFRSVLVIWAASFALVVIVSIAAPAIRWRLVWWLFRKAERRRAQRDRYP